MIYEAEFILKMTETNMRFYNTISNILKILPEDYHDESIHGSAASESYKRIKSEIDAGLSITTLAKKWDQEQNSD